VSENTKKFKATFGKNAKQNATLDTDVNVNCQKRDRTEQHERNDEKKTTTTRKTTGVK
jgi:hypothetical protein